MEQFTNALYTLEKIDDLDSCQLAFDAFFDYARQIGASNSMAGQIAGLNQDVPEFSPLLFLSDAAMLDQWYEAEAFRNDPVIGHALLVNQPFTWDQAFRASLRGGPSFGEYTELFRTPNALEIPVHSPFRPAGGVSVLLEREALSNLERNAVHLVVLGLFQKFDNFAGMPKAGLRQRLTARERSVLAYAAVGRTDQEISDKIGISVHTVRFYFRSISEKLNTLNRTHSVAVALQIGAIVP